MSSEAQMVIGVWEAVRDVIPASKREDAAVGILRAMEDFGLERSDLAAIEEEDDHLASAMQTVFGDHEDFDGDYDGEE